MDLHSFIFFSNAKSNEITRHQKLFANDPAGTFLSLNTLIPRALRRIIIF